jgi:excisionase family DNA binding protein
MTERKTTNLTSRELGEELSLHPQHVRDLARLGAIPAKRIGSNWRFDLDKVEEQLERNAALAVQRSIIASNFTEE